MSVFICATSGNELEKPLWYPEIRRRKVKLVLTNRRGRCLGNQTTWDSLRRSSRPLPAPKACVVTSLPERRGARALGLASLLHLGGRPAPRLFRGGGGAVAMAAVTDVQRLQARVEELERWVYGPGGSRGSRKVSGLGPAVPS